MARGYVKKEKQVNQSISVLQTRDALKYVIIKHGCSIADAAAKFDIDECRAEYILFSKKPTKEQIAHAFEIYDKGFPFIMACVSAGVAPKFFKKAKREKQPTQYRPVRW